MSEKLKNHKQTQKKSAAAKTVSFMIGILLTIDIFVLLVSGGLHYGVFSERVLQGELLKSSYYTGVYEEIAAASNEIWAVTKLPDELLEKSITKRQVYLDGKKYVENVLNGKSQKFESEKVKEELDSNIKAYFKEKKIENNDTLNQSVDLVLESIQSQYNNKISADIIGYWNDYKDNGSREIMWVSIFMMFILVVLLKLLSKHRASFYKYIFSAWIGGSVINFAMLFLLRQGIIKSIEEMKITYYYNFIRGLFTQTITMMIIISAILFVLFVTMVVLNEFIKKMKEI